MKYIGENAIKKLISLIKGDLATKQPTITASGLLKGDGAGTVTAADTQEATLVDVPNGLLKGDGTTISAAVAEMDYMVPPTGGTTGQVLKKTETGTEWADAPQTVTIPETTALLKGDGTGGVAAADSSDYLPTAQKGAAGGVASLGEDGKVPGAQLPEMGAEAYTVTLTTSGWSDNGDWRFKQTISVPGVTTNVTQVIMVDVALTGTDLDADAASLEAWSIVSANNVAQGSGTLTFYCTEVPTVNIPVFVGVI